MSYTLPNSTLLDPVVGDSATGNLFTVEADLQAMLDFEAGLRRHKRSSGFCRKLPRRPSRLLRQRPPSMRI